MRRVWDIHGGIHPPENKQQSLTLPIRHAPVPPQLVLPLLQHSGAPSEPVVTVGERVDKGQPIARASGAFSAALHAPTSGEILEIGPRPIAHPSGMSAPCIVLKTDGEERWTTRSPLPDYRMRERGEVLEKIRAAGIAGMGGAGFPAAVKLSPPPKKTITTLIINGTECEPYITADDALMRERADQIVAGTRILAWLLDVHEILIGIEDNKPEAIAAMRRAADTGMDVISFPTKYPSGGEKQLIQILTGKEVPSGGLPADLGIVCQNVGTTAAVHRAVELGEPLISRVTTVTGQAVAQAQNFEVLLGTPMRFLLELAGVDERRFSRLIMGGPMMGFALDNADVPVIKTTNCLLAPTLEELPLPPPAQACIRCGMCAEACPASLLPQQLYWYAQAQDYEQLAAHHIFDCIECGACSYVCPSSIPLVQYYRASKATIRQQQEQQRKSDIARQRFEARQARIQRQEEEKEARRKARQRAATKPAGGSAQEAKTEHAALVEAAVERVRAKKLATAGEHRDIVGEAIERARQKALTREGGESAAPAASTDAAAKIESLEKRIAKAKEKLEEARASGAPTVDALAAGLASLEQKLNAARAAAGTGSTGTTPTAADSAAAAIERAKAQRAAGPAAPEDPLASLQRTLASSEQKLAKARAKLDAARAAGDTETVAVLEQSIGKLEERLAETRSRLAQQPAVDA